MLGQECGVGHFRSVCVFVGGAFLFVEMLEHKLLTLSGSQECQHPMSCGQCHKKKKILMSPA